VQQLQQNTKEQIEKQYLLLQHEFIAESDYTLKVETMQLAIEKLKD